MQRWQLCVLVVASVALEGVRAIHCYSCVSDGDDACRRGDRAVLPLKKCDLGELKVTGGHAADVGQGVARLFDVDIQTLEPHLPMNCLKQITRVGGKEVVLRGCQLAAAEQLDICVKLKQHNQDTIHTSYCSLCNNDGCNAASLGRPFGLLAILIAAILLLRC